MRVILGSMVLLLLGCGAADDRTISSQGDAERGAMVFETCSSCHALVVDPAEPYFGPQLEGIFGRPVAADPNYDYSQALRSLEGTWDEPRLAEYLLDPRTFAPGTTMVQALPDSQDVADVLAYMRREVDAASAQ